VQIIVEVGVRSLTYHLQRLARHVFGIVEPLRNVDLPMLERRLDRIDPCGNARFAGIDLLSATD
jgi:hypothetical protein